MNEYIEELKSKIPEALYDRISEKLLEDQYCSIWICCLECVQEMADTWEEVKARTEQVRAQLGKEK